MKQMRIWHRYLGFFLVGIMAMYALSGLIMIFRNTDFLKTSEQINKTIQPGIPAADLGKALDMRRLKVEKEDSTLIYFENGTYNKQTGNASYVIKDWPPFINKLTQLHKARSGDPLYLLNVFFGVALLFFVVSSFWMFKPDTAIFKKGMLYVIAGMVLTILLILFQKK